MGTAPVAAEVSGAGIVRCECVACQRINIYAGLTMCKVALVDGCH